MARRRQAVTRLKTSITHADTKLINAGAGAIPDTFEVLETEAGLRTTTGGTQTITDSRSTGEVVNVGDIVKYINLFLEVGPRFAAVATDRIGWLEWALVMVKESETTVPITDTGTQTLGTICKNMFRNECIYTGHIPVGSEQTNSQSIAIKVPRFKQKITLGDEWRFITYFRSTSSVSTEVAAVRVIKSFMYKGYN